MAKITKEIAIVRDSKTGLWKMQFTTGGELPQALTGLFTTEQRASIVKQSFLENRK